MTLRGAAAPLIDATRWLATPFVGVDTSVMASNLAAMQSECERGGVALRPHVKTHKSSFIAGLQLAAGATGLACATLSEAVGLANANIATEILVAIPVFIDEPKADLVRTAASGHRRLLLAADSVAIVDSIIAGGFDAERVGILVEVDSGLGRTGLDPAGAGALAKQIGSAGGLALAGFFTHGGHGYVPGAAPQAGADERSSLAAALDHLGAGQTGHASSLIVSAGSTPTALLSAGPPVTEERPGTYVFGDVQQVHLGQTELAGVASTVVATVIHSGEDRYVVDAGAKILTKDRPAWTDSYGMVRSRPADVIVQVYDNHGVIVPTPGTGTPAVGERIAIIPNHICPVINLVDSVAAFDPATGGISRIDIDLRGHLT